MIADVVVVVIAYYAALSLRLNDIWPIGFLMRSIPLLIVLVSCSVVAGYVVSSHAIKLRSYESNAIARSAAWAAIVAGVGFVLNLAFDLGSPRTVPIIFGFLAFFLTLAVRFSLVLFLNWLEEGSSNKIPVAIYGAGAGGLQLLAALRNSSDYKPVLLVDKDKALQRLMISGMRVHSPAALNKYADRGKIEEIFLAFPSLNQTQRSQVLNDLKDIDCKVSELPSYEDIVRSGGVLRSLKPLEPEELLGRKDVQLTNPELERQYAKANILISGAGGSIGSELCRKVLAVNAKKIVLFERSEFALYAIEKELRQIADDNPDLNAEIIPVLGSVNNGRRVRQILKQHDVEIVLHAAAYKHVPLVEINTSEGVRNNVIGTLEMAQAAVDSGVKRFIMISTDKAVRPTSIMGASKRLAELIIQDLQSRSADCVFGIVRFGNVLGSSGSVIPLFREQIKNGGPVTLTHTDVTRYFMTIEEAAYLVLLAGTFAENGEVFVLDMGEPVRIEDLAKRMITMSGLSVRDASNPNGDIEIKLTGLREGEKLFEELLVGDDPLPTPHKKIFRSGEKSLDAKNIADTLKTLNSAIDKNDKESILRVLKDCVESYAPERSNPVN